ncbi:hypothetical protein [Parendozoicomonas haliclonae]|nr:hypothetical protein [Parendozoicomonas haliclonae]
MKKFFAVFLYLLPVLAFAQTAVFKEGTHYEIIEELQASSQPMVTELFSIYCGGCYQWEYGPLGSLQAWLSGQNIGFDQVHMEFMGDYARQASTALAMTQNTPQEASVKKALFGRIHEQRRGDWGSEKEFYQTLEQAGLTKADYDKKKRSLATRKRLMAWNRYADHVTSVPSFMVNNRYLINMGSLSSYDELHGLIAYLSKKTAVQAQ